MRLVWKILGCLVVTVSIFAVPRPALACSVCVELPEYSLADRILSAQVIVLAAASVEDPFKYAPVSLLKGTPDQLATLPEIPFLIDSVTRSALRSDPKRTVLMLYGGGYLDKAGRSYSNTWTKSFLMTPERADFLDAVRAQGGNWANGVTGNPKRVAFFGELLTHEDRLLRNTALIEVHRAPYPIAREVLGAVPTALLLRELRIVNRLAYAPAAIRLLGLQSDPEAKAVVRTQYRSALRSNSPHLVDWALAGVEIDGMVAVDAIGESLAQRNWTHEDKRKLVQVLADAGAAHPEFQVQIAEIYKRELKSSVLLAGWIALAVNAWGTDLLNASFRELLALQQVDPAALFLIQNALENDDFK